MSPRIIDFHSHAFSDALAARAMKALTEEAPGVRAYLGHPAGYVLFGTDSPWKDQAETLRWVERLRLPPETLSQLLAGNALKLLGLT